MNIHFLSFFLGCGFGIVNELVIKLIHKGTSILDFCQENKLKCFLNATVLNVYGYVFLITSILADYIKNWNIAVQFLILSLLIGLVEHYTYGLYWNYWGQKKNPLLHDFNNCIPVFKGKTSILSMVYFSFVLLIYIHFVIPKLKSISNKNA